MATIIVRHKVQDFDAWLPFFEQHAEARRAAGGKGAKVYRKTDNPNDVTIIFDVADAAKFLALGESGAMRDILQESGVIGAPSMTVLTAAGSYPV